MRLRFASGPGTSILAQSFNYRRMIWMVARAGSAKIFLTAKDAKAAKGTPHHSLSVDIEIVAREVVDSAMKVA